MAKKVTIEEVLARFKKVHGDKYDYSKVVYERMHSNITIICPIHGEFRMTPHSHLAGQGCPKCGIEKRSKARMDTIESFIEKAKKVHGDKYDYSKVAYKSSQKKVCIVCPEHGEFWQRPYAHLNGNGCPMCKFEILKKNSSDTTDSFIEKAKAVYGDKYDYSLTKYQGTYKPIKVICPKHGVFPTIPNRFLRGVGCPTCGYENSHKLKYNTEKFIELAKGIHGDKYNYEKTKYDGILTNVVITCPKHGDFLQKPTDHLAGCGCRKCNIRNSKFDIEVYDFVREIFDDAVMSDRQTLGNMEIDVLIPSKSIGIECNGLYWHSEAKRDKNYHLSKMNRSNKMGIRLIQIFEDEWVYKKDIVKSRLKNILGVTERKIYARNCEIRKVEFNEINEFLEKSHIQGKVYSSENYALYFSNELVSLMTFGKRRVNLGSHSKDGCYELLRFCNALDTTVIGGASRLLKHFISTVRPKEIISYCDLRWSDGNLYETLGFTLDHISKPNYFYVINDKRKNRFMFRKDELVKEGYDPNKTEHQIMLERGIYRIYDCGCKVYKMEFE